VKGLAITKRLSVKRLVAGFGHAQKMAALGDPHGQASQAWRGHVPIILTISIFNLIIIFISKNVFFLF
jgi:hypothetical protein